jgi:hypothetical protein
VLAADEVLLRDGLAGMHDRSGFEVAGQAGNASDSAARCQQTVNNCNP